MQQLGGYGRPAGRGGCGSRPVRGLRRGGLPAAPAPPSGLLGGRRVGQARRGAVPAGGAGAAPGRAAARRRHRHHGGRRRRRVRGGQGRRRLRPAALRAAAAGAGAGRQRALLPRRVLLPRGRGLHQRALLVPALLRLQPQRGRLSLRHRRRRPRLPRLPLLLHGGPLLPTDQQRQRPQVPGDGGSGLLRALDLPLVRRLLLPDQPVGLDTGLRRARGGRLCPCRHRLQLLLHLLVGAAHRLRLQEVQDGGGGLCAELRGPLRGGVHPLLQLPQCEPRQLPAAALHPGRRRHRGLPAAARVLSAMPAPRVSPACNCASRGGKGGLCNLNGANGGGCFV